MQQKSIKGLVDFFTFDDHFVVEPMVKIISALWYKFKDTQSFLIVFLFEITKALKSSIKKYSNRLYNFYWSWQNLHSCFLQLLCYPETSQ